MTVCHHYFWNVSQFVITNRASILKITVKNKKAPLKKLLQLVTSILLDILVTGGCVGC